MYLLSFLFTVSGVSKWQKQSSIKCEPSLFSLKYTDKSCISQHIRRQRHENNHATSYGKNKCNNRIYSKSESLTRYLL